MFSYEVHMFSTISMDWFKGKFTGNPIFNGKIYGFRLRFSPTNQSIDHLGTTQNFAAGKPQTHPSDQPLDGAPSVATATATPTAVTATASPKKRAQLDVDLSSVSMKESPNRSRVNDP